MALEVAIQKKVGKFHLDIAFTAENNEVFALLGSSGCGKTMTLRCIAGIAQPDSGRIVLDNRVLYDSEKKINLPPRKRNVGYFFQSYALFPNMTVEENIRAGLPRGKDETAVEKMMEKLYLTERRDHYPNQLSGGQQQRTALARLLISEPTILLLDEPFSALDSYLKWKLELELMTVLDEFKGATVFVSHNRDEVFRLCQTIGVMEDGLLQTVAEKNQMFDHPETISAALLSGCKNFSRATPIGGNGVYCTDWGATLTLGENAADCHCVGVRGHYWTIATEGDENVIPVTVQKVIEDTFSIIYLLDCTESSADAKGEYKMIRWEVSKRNSGKRYQKGEQFSVSIDPQQVLTFQTA